MFPISEWAPATTSFAGSPQTFPMIMPRAHETRVMHQGPARRTARRAVAAAAVASFVIAVVGAAGAAVVDDDQGTSVARNHFVRH